MPVDADRATSSTSPSLGASSDQASGRAPGVASAEAVERAAAALGALARRSVPIGPMTTYRVGGAAALFVTITDVEQLHAVADARRRSGLPVLVLGRGSNMLVSDDGFAGIALSLVDLPERIEIDEATSRVTASAGLALPVVARKTAAAGLTGFEWAVGVPGTIGGAVRMNAGGHGSDMAAALVSVEVFDLATSEQRSLGVEELGLGFRSSALAPEHLVLSAELQLAPGDVTESARTLKEIVAWRRANQPGGQNAGSVFVNPVPGEVSAGALIDAAGLRGHRVGSAEVSTKHANFIQADEGGRAADVRALMAHVRERVEQTSGFRLRSEIRLVGFGDEDEG
jgi:UDP-N-acetylmuramate dehydrogenase